MTSSHRRVPAARLLGGSLLASAATLVTVPATAADLGVKKPSPVEYVRVCGASGAGFFFIPGTETCLKIGGRVRYQYGYVEPTNRNSSRVGTRGEGRINLDSRTQTDYGVLRAFVQIDAAYRTGAERSGSRFRQGEAQEDVTGFLGTRAQTYIDVSQAFIQFAGFTAGKTTSFSDQLGTHEIITNSYYSFNQTVNLIAYTYSPLSGLNVTLSVEDPVTRRLPVALSTGAGAVNGNLGGIRLPDFILDARYQQSWGIVKLSGVVHEVATSNLGVNTTTEYGFAIAGSAKINLPFITTGDNLLLNAAFGQGALDYVGSFGFNNSILAGVTAVGVTGQTADGVFNAAGRLLLPSAYSFAGSFQHFWTPTFSQAVFASYINVDFPRGVNGLPIATTLTAVPIGRDYEAFSVGTNFVWTPVRGLNIGTEVAYVYVDPTGRVFDQNRGTGFTLGSGDQWFGRLRIARDF